MTILMTAGAAGTGTGGEEGMTLLCCLEPSSSNGGGRDFHLVLHCLLHFPFTQIPLPFMFSPLTPLGQPGMVTSARSGSQHPHHSVRYCPLSSLLFAFLKFMCLLTLGITTACTPRKVLPFPPLKSSAAPSLLTPPQTVRWYEGHRRVGAKAERPSRGTPE